MVIISSSLKDVALKRNDLIALRKSIERVYDEKVKLQNDIEKELHSQQTIDKASKYSKKVTSKLRQTLMSKVICLVSVIFGLE